MEWHLITQWLEKLQKCLKWFVSSGFFILWRKLLFHGLKKMKHRSDFQNEMSLTNFQTLCIIKKRTKKFVVGELERESFCVLFAATLLVFFSFVFWQSLNCLRNHLSIVIAFHIHHNFGNIFLFRRVGGGGSCALY